MLLTNLRIRQSRWECSFHLHTFLIDFTSNSVPSSIADLYVRSRFKFGPGYCFDLTSVEIREKNQIHVSEIQVLTSICTYLYWLQIWNLIWISKCGIFIPGVVKHCIFADVSEQTVINSYLCTLSLQDLLFLLLDLATDQAEVICKAWSSLIASECIYTRSIWFKWVDFDIKFVLPRHDLSSSTTR